MLGAAVFALQAIALAIILVPAGLPVMLLAVTLLGIGRGGLTLMRATLVADRYGRAHYATISGIPAAAQMAARAVAPIGGGLLVTWLDGYAPMLVALTLIALASVAAMLMFAASARPLRLW
jgi:MFS family permease